MPKITADALSAHAPRSPLTAADLLVVPGQDLAFTITDGISRNDRSQLRHEVLRTFSRKCRFNRRAVTTESMFANSGSTS